MILLIIPERLIKQSIDLLRIYGQKEQKKDPSTYIIEPRIGEQNYLEIKEEIANIDNSIAYQENITNLLKEKSQLDIIWGEDITNIQKKHIQAFLEARGFTINVLTSSNSPLSSNPEMNTLYIGNNPYNTTTGTTEPNRANEYIQSIFKADTNTTFPLDNNTPILYINSDIVF
jgi:hypothetical protein